MLPTNAEAPRMETVAIRHLSARFEVSVQAMTIRLVRLGLLPA